MKQKSTTRKITNNVPTYRLFTKTGMFQDYKVCPNCGQNEIPFKKGICPKCSNQIGNIQYVKDPQEYVKSNYGSIKMGIEELYQEIDELYQEIDEL